MAAIGNSPTQQAFTPAIDYFSGNGSTTAFTLSRPVASVAQVQVTIDNVAQNPSSAYTVSANTITFTSAPLSGTNNIYVYYTSPITQVIAPGQGTVGTTQIQNGVTVNFADGTAAAPSITNDGDTNTGIFFPAADTIAFSEGGAESMRIDSSGNVGIGTTSPTALTSNKALTINSPTGFGSLLDLKTNETLNLRVFSNATNSGLSVKTATPLLFETNDTTRMAIDSSGNVGIGTASPSYKLDVQSSAAGVAFVRVYNSTSNEATIRYTTQHSASSDYKVGASITVANAFEVYSVAAATSRLIIDSSGNLLAPAAYNNTTGSGANAFIAGNGTFQRSTSSLKYKKNVANATHGLTDLLKLRSVTYEGKSEGDSGKTFGGLIAEEVHDAGLTEFVQYAEDGSPDALAYGNMVALCVKSIQELKAINDTQAETINALTARIEALENR
jgi:hypothetical protein